MSTSPELLEVRYVDDAQALGELCRELAGAPWVALDTEFVRERTYYPRLCLVQVATPDGVAVVDPIRLPETAPFLDLLFDPGVLKVVHAGRQDLEIFWNLRGGVPLPVFDTQIAAALLGRGDQIGYGALVRDLLDVELAKGHTRADWSRRPLSADQIEYAADDVRYLAALYPRLRESLEARGRLPWLETEAEGLADPATYEEAPESSWLRVKGADRLPEQSRSVLQLLAAWREETARREDRPRRWVMRDDLLLALARARPGSGEDLARVDGLSDRLRRRYGQALLGVVADARSRPPAPAPAGRRSERLTPEARRVAADLAAAVRRVAADAGIEPTMLATRRDLERLAAGEDARFLLRGWREPLLGPPLAEVLAGSAPG